LIARGEGELSGRLPSGKSGSIIIIWDLKKNRKQVRIDNLGQDWAIAPGTTLQWTPDGKFITFGTDGNPIKFWDSLTGSVTEVAPAGVVADALVFNRNGSEALASTVDFNGGINNRLLASSHIRIYDTTTWQSREFNTGPFQVQAVGWTVEGKILAVGIWNSFTYEKMMAADSHALKKDFQGLDIQALHYNDELGQLIDPSGQQPTLTKLLVPAIPRINNFRGKDHTWYDSPLLSQPFMMSDASGATFAFGISQIIDGRTLKVFTYAPSADINGRMLTNSTSSRNIALSPNGNHLYWISGSSEKGKGVVVMDARTGKPLSWLNGGYWGIAIRSDGKLLALGNRSSVELFSIQ
jgi:WD40 repeat protein